MQIFSILSFGSNKHAYECDIKKHYKNGELPTVKRGFYGEILTLKNVSVEHLKPWSQGGRTEWKNVVLASKKLNTIRGKKDIKTVVNPVAALKYFEQFRGIRVGNFDGDKYIKLAIDNLKEMGVYLTSPGVRKKMKERPFKKTAQQLRRSIR